MKSWIFLTILLVSVSGYVDEWNLVHSNKYYNEIHDCLEEISILWDELRNYIDIGTWKGYFLYELSWRFQMITVHIDELNSTVANIVNDLVRRRELRSNETTKVRVSLVNALLDCIDDNRTRIQNDIVNESDYHELPHFNLELPKMSELLDLILIDLESFSDQNTLCRFARNALRILESIPERTSTVYISQTLRSWWRTRAENFFDFANELPYIRHSYDSMNFTRLYTTDNPSLFNTRVRTNYNIRSPSASEGDISRVLNFHPRDRNVHDKYLFYSYASRCAMTEADYFYEMHENRFFRVLFFFLELVERGIVGVDDDASPNRVVPEYLLQILHNDTVYGQYLEMKKNSEINSGYGHRSLLFNKHRNSLRQHARILEIDVVMLIYYRLKSVNITINRIGMNTITAGSITLSVYTETKEEDGSIGEDSNSKEAFEKLISKSSNSNSDKNINTCQYSRKTKANYGYISDTDNSKETLVSKEDDPLLKDSEDTFSGALTSVLPNRNGSSCQSI